MVNEMWARAFQMSVGQDQEYTVWLINCVEKKYHEEFKNSLLSVENPQTARDFRGSSLLHLAAEYDNEEIAKYMVDMGSDVNLQDFRGQTALMIALKRQNFTTAKVLLEAKADVSICDMFGISALQMAIMTNPIVRERYATPSIKSTDAYWQIIIMVLNNLDNNYSSDAEKVATQLLQIRCPLSPVVFMENSEVMRIMIKKGSPVDAKDGFLGKTALHWAVEYGKLEKVKILLDCDADIGAIDYWARTPLMYIYNRNDHKVPDYEVELVQVLLLKKATISMPEKSKLVREMKNIFRFGSKDAIRIALELFDDLHLQVDDGSLLHSLASNTNSGIVEVIKGQIMSVNYRNYLGDTPFANAIGAGNYNFAKLLINKGANIELGNYHGFTPMMILFVRHIDMNNQNFTVQKRLNCLELMLEHGGDPEKRFDNENTILDVGISDDKLAPLIEYVLAHLALKQATGALISEVFCQKISSNEQFKNYFDLCVSQLEEAKTLAIFRSVTLLNFLMDSDNIVALYARKKSLITNVSKLIDQVNFKPYYMKRLRKRFLVVSQIAKSREKAEEIISQNIGKLYEYNSIISKMIVEFLSDEDVNKLVQSNGDDI